MVKIEKVHHSQISIYIINISKGSKIMGKTVVKVKKVLYFPNHDTLIFAPCVSQKIFLSEIVLHKVISLVILNDANMQTR